MMFSEQDMGLLLDAVQYAAVQHRDQHRKGSEQTPYINHPIEVTTLLWQVGGVREMPVLLAAVLHDTVEDTEATIEAIESRFGAEVGALVTEVTDDKSLPKAVRKELQIEHAPHISRGAKQIKLADKISNVAAIGKTPPIGWSWERRAAYLDWAEQVVQGLRGANATLERLFDEVLQAARQAVDTDGS